MASYNKVILEGNLGKDAPSLKAMPSGESVCNFSMATTETWKGKDGTKQTSTDWHNIVVYGKKAEIAEKYLAPGNCVLVEGKIRYREYTNKEGVKKKITEIIVFDFVLQNQRDKSEGGGGSREYGEAKTQQEASAPAYGTAPADPFGDDIPF